MKHRSIFRLPFFLVDSPRDTLGSPRGYSWGKPPPPVEAKSTMLCLDVSEKSTMLEKETEIILKNNAHLNWKMQPIFYEIVDKEPCVAFNSFFRNEEKRSMINPICFRCHARKKQHFCQQSQVLAKRTSHLVAMGHIKQAQACWKSEASLWPPIFAGKLSI